MFTKLRELTLPTRHNHCTNRADPGMSTNPNELAPPPPRASRRRLGPILLGLFAVVALPVVAVVLGLLAMVTVHVRTQTANEPESYTTDALWRLVDQQSQNGTLDQLTQKRFTVKGLVCYYARPIPDSPTGRMAISRTGEPDAPDRVVVWLDNSEPIDKGMDVTVRGEFTYEDSYIVLRHAEIVEVKHPLER